MEQSLTLCWDGPRGSGKTLSMVFDAIIRLIRGIRVWSNIKIEFQTDILSPGQLKYYESEPITMDTIYSFDSGIAHGWVYIDELPLWVNSRRSQSVANALMNNMLSIMRHRGLSFGFTSQQFDWLDKRVKYQVDTLASCFDLHFKFPSIPPGALVGLTIKDLSGLTTGHPYHVTGRVEQRQLYAKPFWYCYDSWQEFDVIDAFRPVERGRVAKVLRSDVEGGYTITDKGYDAFGAESVASQIVLEMLDNNDSSILANEVVSRMQQAGVMANLNQLSPILKRAGLVYHRGRVGKYILGLDN